MAVNKDQVKELLGSGLSNEIVASAVGCEPQYITQLMADENFAAEVIALRTASLQANSKRDRNIDRLEDKVIDKLEQAMDTMYKPQELLRTFQVLNAAKRRGVPAHESVTVNQQIVNLNIPQQVIQNFVMNRHGEVIEAEGQTLVTMPAKQLLAQLSASSSGEHNDKYRKIAGFIPGSGRDAEFAEIADEKLQREAAAERERSLQEAGL